MMVILTYEGEGTLSSGGKTILVGSFTLSHDLQRPHGLLLTIDSKTEKSAEGFEHIRRLTEAAEHELYENLDFEGTAIGDESVTIRGLLPAKSTLSGDGTVKLALIPISTAEIGRLEKGSAVRFFIPNLLFAGIHSTKCEIEPGCYSIRRDTLCWEIKDESRAYRIHLQQLSDYETAKVKIRDQGISEWTSMLMLELEKGGQIDLETAIDIADDFMLLTSFAMGKLLSWVVADILQGETVVYRQIKRGSVSPVKALPGGVLGEERFIGDFTGNLVYPYFEFISTALPKYRTMSEDQRSALRLSIISQCQAVENYFSPGSLTLTNRAFEVLIKEFLDIDQQQYTLDEVDLKEELMRRLKEFADFWERCDPTASKEFCERLDGYVTNLLRRPIKSRIKTLLDLYLSQMGNDYDPSWVNAFINARHQAAHDGEVSAKSQLAWLKGNSLLERILLKLLGYSGPYIDRSGSQGMRFEWAELK